MKEFLAKLLSWFRSGGVDKLLADVDKATDKLVEYSDKAATKAEKLQANADKVEGQLKKILDLAAQKKQQLEANADRAKAAAEAVKAAVVEVK